MGAPRPGSTVRRRAEVEVAAGCPVQSMPRRDSSSNTRAATTSPSSSRCPRTTGLRRQCLTAPKRPTSHPRSKRPSSRDSVRECASPDTCPSSLGRRTPVRGSTTTRCTRPRQLRAEPGRPCGYVPHEPERRRGPSLRALPRRSRRRRCPPTLAALERAERRSAGSRGFRRDSHAGCQDLALAREWLFANTVPRRHLRRGGRSAHRAMAKAARRTFLVKPSGRRWTDLDGFSATTTVSTARFARRSRPAVRKARVLAREHASVRPPARSDPQGFRAGAETSPVAEPMVY
jgi:hypothetical protein